MNAPEQTSPIVFRPYHPHDETAILDLFARCFHTRMDLDHWNWKYSANPYARHRILVAERAGTIIAHYAAYPVPIHEGGRAIGFAHQIGDVMTDPAVRGTGFGKNSVIARLAQAFYETCRQQGVLFDFGVPSAKHLRLGKLVLDYHSIGPVQEWRLEAADGKSFRRPFGASERTARSCRLVREIPDFNRVESLFRRLQPALGIAVGREAPYLAWRYLQRPRQNYRHYQIFQGEQLVLWAVVQPRPQELALGDVLLDPSVGVPPFHLLLAALGRDFGGLPLVLWSPSRPAWWLERLAAVGFRPRSQPLALGTAFTFFDHSRFDLARMQRDWFYALADFDLF